MKKRPLKSSHMVLTHVSRGCRGVYNNPPEVGPGTFERKDSSIGPQHLSKRKNHSTYSFAKGQEWPATKITRLQNNQIDFVFGAVDALRRSQVWPAAVRGWRDLEIRRGPKLLWQAGLAQESQCSGGGLQPWHPRYEIQDKGFLVSISHDPEVSFPWFLDSGHGLYMTLPRLFDDTPW